MKLVVNALLASLPSMTNVLLVCSLFILIFSIAGVNFFKGTFYSCHQPHPTVIEKSNATHNWIEYLPAPEIDMDLVKTKDDCVSMGGMWRNAPANFDNTLNAMTTLFQMTTTEGWVDVMNNGIDSVEIDKQPIQNNQQWLVIYFVAFMIVGS